jgi:hypothetical protein
MSALLRRVASGATPPGAAGVSARTPGEWTFDGILYIWAAPSKMVADLSAGMSDTDTYLARMRGVGRKATPEEQNANGYLMAAAPELLRELTSIRKVLSDVLVRAPGYDWNVDPLYLTLSTGAALTSAQAAIDKAEPAA